MNYGLNNNTGLGYRQTNNKLNNFKKGLTSAKKVGDGLNKIRELQNGLTSNSGYQRAKTIASLFKN